MTLRTTSSRRSVAGGRCAGARSTRCRSAMARMVPPRRVPDRNLQRSADEARFRIPRWRVVAGSFRKPRMYGGGVRILVQDIEYRHARCYERSEKGKFAGIDKNNLKREIYLDSGRVSGYIFQSRETASADRHRHWRNGSCSALGAPELVRAPLSIAGHAAPPCGGHDRACDQNRYETIAISRRREVVDAATHRDRHLDAGTENVSDTESRVGKVSNIRRSASAENVVEFVDRAGDLPTLDAYVRDTDSTRYGPSPSSSPIRSVSSRLLTSARRGAEDFGRTHRRKHRADTEHRGAVLHVDRRLRTLEDDIHLAGQHRRALVGGGHVYLASRK